MKKLFEKFADFCIKNDIDIIQAVLLGVIFICMIIIIIGTIVSKLKIY